jgi:hypothetical protein
LLLLCRVISREEEESKRPKNFALNMVDDLDDQGTDQLRRAKQAQSVQSYRKQKMETRDQIR